MTIRLMSLLRSLLRPRVALGAAVGFYAYDYTFKYQRFHRNIRSLAGAVVTVYDYKYEWPKTVTVEEQSAIHDRVLLLIDKPLCLLWGSHMSRYKFAQC
jgi:hypothetical protein